MLSRHGEQTPAIVVVQGTTRETLRLFGDSYAVALVRAAMFNGAISWSPFRQTKPCHHIIDKSTAAPQESEFLEASMATLSEASYFDSFGPPAFLPAASGKTHIATTMKTAVTMMKVAKSARTGEPFQ